MTSNTTNPTNSVESGQKINLDEITAIVCTECGQDYTKLENLQDHLIKS